MTPTVRVDFESVVLRDGIEPVYKIYLSVDEAHDLGTALLAAARQLARNLGWEE